jgi:hypothetical protein
MGILNEAASDLGYGGKVCGVGAPDRSGRTCDKPAGHAGEHWTFGGDEAKWPQGATVGRNCESQQYSIGEMSAARNEAAGSGAARLSTLDWARERLANTGRIAAEKTGDDRASWLEDEAYWLDIVAQLEGWSVPHIGGDGVPEGSCIVCGQRRPFGTWTWVRHDVAVGACQECRSAAMSHAEPCHLRQAFVQKVEKQIDRLLVDIANLSDDVARWRTLHDEVKADLAKTTLAWAEAADERDLRRGERDECLAVLKKAERVMTDADLDHEPADDDGRIALEATRAAIAKYQAQ